MSKLFKFRAYWYNDQSEPNKGVDEGIIAAESYATAAKHIEDYYDEELASLYIEEVDNPLFICEIEKLTKILNGKN